MVKNINLALEDNQRRLTSRIKTLGAEDSNHKWTEFITESKSLARGGLDLIDQWLKMKTNPKLVIIDTLEKFKGDPDTSSSDAYSMDYSMMSKFKRMAEAYGVTILLVHHLRKMEASDCLDIISASTGLTGSADTIWIMERARTEDKAILHITGRDVEESCMALVSPKSGL